MDEDEQIVRAIFGDPLIDAIDNTKRVHTIDAYCNEIMAPGQAARYEANRRAWAWGAVAFSGLIVLTFIIVAIMVPAR